MTRAGTLTGRLRSLRIRGPSPTRLLAAVAGIVLMLALAGASLPAPAVPAVSHFVTRPDLRPPAVDVHAEGPLPGYVFLSPATEPGGGAPPGAQSGLLIVDDTGQPVWFHPIAPAMPGNPVAANFQVQRYRGEPVLTWWQGEEIVPPGMGHGKYIIMDSSYHRIATVRAGNGLQGDLHEFQITPRGTALITAYHEVTRPKGPVFEGVVQEIDIETGRVLFEWHSLRHVPLSASHVAREDHPGMPYDYFHINAVEVANDGNLLISARHTSTIYKIDRDTGAVIWRLGGQNSDFRMGPGTDFGYQHDVRQHPNGTITIFDNGTPGVDSRSRAIVLRLDRDTMTATLIREYPAPGGWFSFSQGSAQLLPGGGMLVGWGSQPYVTGFERDGDVVFSAVFGPNMDSYRAFRLPWTGRPYYPPTAAVRPGPDGGLVVYASWNGSTETVRWRVLAGPQPGRLRPVRTAPRDGFETAIVLGAAGPAADYIAVQALNADGEVLDTSQPVDTLSGTFYPATPARCPRYGPPVPSLSC